MLQWQSIFAFTPSLWTFRVMFKFKEIVHYSDSQMLYTLKESYPPLAQFPGEKM